MKNKFELEKSIFAIMGFVAIVGLFFMLVRSDYVIQYHHFSTQAESEPIERGEEPLSSSFKQPSYLLLTGDDAPQLAEQVAFVLNNMGKQVISRPLGEVYSLNEKYDGVIIATEMLDTFPDPDSLLRYVENGGAVFFAIRPSPGPSLSALYQQLDIIEIGSFVETEGIKLTNPFFQSDLSASFLSDRIINSSLTVRLSPEADLQASSSSGIPLLWKTEYGAGQFVMFNGSMLAQSSEQALLIKGIQLIASEFIYPVLNAGSTVLEGFPFPVPEGRHPNGSITYDDYYRYLFWSGMQRIEAKYDLNYTAAFIATFNEGNTSLKRKELSRNQENMILYGRELLRMGGEMGIQGYNYLPIEGMDSSDVNLQQRYTSERMKQALPGYQIHSYVPVQQQDPLAHLAIIQSYYPDLQAILASVHAPFLLDDTSKKAKKPVAVLPKTFTGFKSDAYSNWLVFNSLVSFGYYAQSLQPQSFLDGQDAETALHDFERFSNQLKQDVPWLRRTVLSDAARSAIHSANTIVYEKKTDHGITFQLNKVSAPSYFFFASNKKITGNKNCDIQKIGTDLYLVETDQLTFSIGLDE